MSLSLAANSGGDAPLQGMSALASTADATNDSVSVNGAMGQTAAFGRGAEDMQDRIDEMRARGELPGGQSGQGNGFQGGPGGPGGPGGGGPIMMGGPPGGGGTFAWAAEVERISTNHTARSFTTSGTRLWMRAHIR